MNRPEFLYLVEFEDHGVKVGVSAQPMHRLKQHHRDAAAFGRKVGRTWISPIAHTEARANERAIKSGASREYLERSFDECLAHAGALTMTPPTKVEGMSALNQFLTGIFPAFGDFLARDCEAAR